MAAVNPSAPFLLPAEQRELWERINDTDGPVVSTTLPVLVAEHAATRPDAPAVTAAGRTLSYAELVARSNVLAGELAATGRRAGQPVAVCVEPGWEQVVAVVGALTAGVAFHAVEPHLGASEVERRLAELNPAVVVTQSWLDRRLTWPDGMRRLAVDSAGSTDPGPPADVPAGGAACLMRADGQATPLVALTDDALIGPLLDLADRFAIGPDDRVLALSPLGDPMSLTCVLAPLVVGASVVVPDELDLRDPSAWTGQALGNGVSVWASPPALLALLVEHLARRGDGVPASLRLVLLGSEPVAPSLVAELRRLAAHPIRIVNLGGAPVAGLWSCCHEVDGTDPRPRSVPIGRPLVNRRAYIVTDASTLCPAWVTGRICYGGRGLASGFWAGGGDDDFLTLEGGERVFRSGQLGRLLPDGVIEVVGDLATRIIVQNHPMNLRDVEAALTAHPEVVAAAVVPDGAGGSTGYVKTTHTAGLTGHDLVDHLRTRMSPLLVPSRIELVAMLPLTPGGLVDRAALAAATVATASRAADRSPDQAAPENDMARKACRMTAELLGVDEVTPTTNLLDLGATSVDLVRLAVNAEQEFGIVVDVEELLRFPAVAVLVSLAPSASPAVEPAGPVEPARPGPTTVADRKRTDTDTDTRASGELVLDPVDRMQFKESRPGIRRDLDREPARTLTRPKDDRERLVARRTVRAFGVGPVRAAALGGLLGVLRQFRSGVEAKFAYPSAGSLYPVQVYVGVAAGRLDGVDDGIYYHHPVRHTLIALAPGVRVHDETHAWINRDAYRSSAFSVYLVARASAIRPMYGDRARDYCLIEAGAMAQLLMTEAAGLGLGTCPVGDLDAAAVRPHLRLEEDDELVHTLLAGPVPDAGSEGATVAQTGMLRRVDGLTGFR